MTVREIADKLNLKVFSGAAGLDREVSGGYVSDLLSDVMGFAKEGSVWVTLQTHKNVMAIATLKELSAVIMVKGLEPEDDAREVSDEEEIPILGSSEQTFELAGRIYALLNP
ncbi:MAG TPA: serine kinase [Candidatus Coprenecus stercoravium]|uniref:Serine kinase n=1 Tax=Candidatus Coprenecus stercoravium TaxID=2840735 RepID=A0A9D2GS18_9BACT|nr:serine kinase [Candidatus Coprenecus stercoravium]